MPSGYRTSRRRPLDVQVFKYVYKKLFRFGKKDIAFSGSIYINLLYLFLGKESRFPSNFGRSKE